MSCVRGLCCAQGSSPYPHHSFPENAKAVLHPLSYRKYLQRFRNQGVFHFNVISMHCKMTVFHSVLIHNKQLVQLLFSQFRKHGFILPAVIHVPVIIDCFALERHLAQAVKTMPSCRFIIARRFLYTSSPPPPL